jgi:uncharacterized protein YihD (DUF1040 family)
MEGAHMYNFNAASNAPNQDEFYAEISTRKNLMVYDGIRDGLDENIRAKYFYSNPGEPLEFVVIDIYKDSVLLRFEGNESEVFGVVNIIKEKEAFDDSELESIYGHIIIRDIIIRDVDKNEITLYLNKNGISDLKSAVLYFEEYFCIKSII